MAARPGTQVKAGLFILIVAPFYLAWHVVRSLATFFLVVGLMLLAWVLLSLLS